MIETAIQPQVTLLSYTPHAAELLLFTKSTRLGMSPDLLESIKEMSDDLKMEELKYISQTIPSSWEMLDFVFLIEDVSRAFTHQLVRNRHGSYAQQSLRVVDRCEFDYILPDRLEFEIKPKVEINTAVKQIKRSYKNMIDMGVAAEDARGILPTNIATNIVAKFNLRTLSEIVASRSGGRTASEYQKVVEGFVDSTLAVYPWLEFFYYGDRDRDYFDDIEAFAEEEFAGDLIKKGRLLKIVDKLRKQK